VLSYVNPAATLGETPPCLYAQPAAPLPGEGIKNSTPQKSPEQLPARAKKNVFKSSPLERIINS